MGKLFGEVKPAVKKETKRIAGMMLVGVVLMWIGFAILHKLLPDTIPFDYTVILAGVIGGSIAVLNFFLMGLAVQKVAACEEESAARNKMKASYTQRMLMLMLWVALAIVLPCFQFAAGIIPLFIPGIGIKLTGIAKKTT